MTLFCLPYAGGSAQSIYYDWITYLKPSIKIYPLELKGRGSRFSEQLYHSINDAVTDVLNQIIAVLPSSDYAILGHSMGSIIAYELYYKIKELKLKEPWHMFFSGQKAPNIPYSNEKISNYPNGRFLRKVINLGGTPEEVLDNEELIDLVLPMLKSDFKLVETYQYIPKKHKIVCDITVIGGSTDRITPDQLMPWKSHTNQSCSFHTIDGDHFFINKNYRDVINILNEIL